MKKYIFLSNLSTKYVFIKRNKDFSIKKSPYFFICLLFYVHCNLNSTRKTNNRTRNNFCLFSYLLLTLQ